MDVLYLGDGAFIEHDGYSFILYTDNGYRRVNEIFLEPDMAEEAVKYIQKERKARVDAGKKV